MKDFNMKNVSPEVEEAGKSFKKLSNYLLNACASGNDLNEDEKEYLNYLTVDIVKEADPVTIQKSAEKFINLDILKSNFKIFEHLDIWKIIYPSAISVCQ